MQDLTFSSATELAAALRRGEVSSAELTEHYIERIERLDGAVNAVVVRDFERARQASAHADAAFGRGENLGPLHGVPMTIKEAYDIERLPTTWGDPAFAANIATSDAESVRRFKAAGAHFLGKTNVPIHLADFQSYNEIYGTTNNPWDLARGPGGSSGGSAAALAAGFSALEAGSDIGGSIRNPSHYCGIYGHKPTWGIVPSQGHALPGDISPPDIAVVGPMARSAEDLALALDIVAGADPMNAAGWRLELPRPTKLKLSEHRIAIWADDPRAPVSSEIAARTEDLGRTLERLGATVSFDARPPVDLDESRVAYHALLTAVMAAGVTEERKAKRRIEAAALDPSDTSLRADSIRYSGIDHGLWLQMNNVRTKIRQQWRSFFDDWDIVVCPVTATTAITHDHTAMRNRTLTVNGEQQAYFQQIFWAGLVGVAHLPSTVFPTGPSADGLPIGLQAVGAEFNDHLTIEFTRLVAQEIGGFTPPPAYS